jgi:hypothetical protein
MADYAFERRASDLAARSGIRIAEFGPQRAKLYFNLESSRQTLWITPFSGGIWEFSCVSAIAVDDPDTIPKFVLISVLQDNSSNKRGFWCIERLGDKYALEYMHNIPESLLTPGEFEGICWSVVKAVDKLESAVKDSFF